LFPAYSWANLAASNAYHNRSYKHGIDLLKGETMTTEEFQSGWCPFCGEYTGQCEANVKFALIINIVKQIQDMTEPSISQVLKQYGYDFESKVVKSLEDLKVE
jgi:hypothetical protein